jgi:pilus assembly protein CpaE
MDNQLRKSEVDVIASVPVITLAAYCETEGMMAVMRSAAADRRMSRASCIIEIGGVAAAAAAYRETRTPSVLIVEVAKGAPDVLASLKPLAEVCDPSTLVIVVGHVNDVVLYRGLIRSGVADYLAAPLTQLQIIDAVAGLFRDPASQPAGRIIAFIGAKGGVGSSTIAHNLSWLFANQSKVNTVVTDLDLSFGTSGLNFNQDVTSGLADAVAQADRLDSVYLDRLLTRCSDNLALLAGAAQLDRDVFLDADTIYAVLDTLRQTAPVVAVDMPSSWSAWSRHTLVSADDVVITATPDLACMRNARNIAELLRASRQNDMPPYLVINQVGVPKRPEISAADFSKAVGIEPSVIIPFDPMNFGNSATTGTILCEMAPKSKAVEEIKALFAMMNARSRAPAPPRPSPEKSILTRLKSAISAGRK